MLAQPAHGRRGWLAASVLGPLLMFGAAAWYDQSAVIGRADDAAAATTHALAEHAKAVLQTASLALDLELNQVAGMDWPQIGSSASVHSVPGGALCTASVTAIRVLCRCARVQLGQQPRFPHASLR